MKKILALLLAITMIAAFCACAPQSADTAFAVSELPPLPKITTYLPAKSMPARTAMVMKPK